MINTKVYKLKLSLDITDSDFNILKKYGCVKEGITRTILVPSDMQLNRLNYAIQKCFGWRNSHLHRFMLTSEKFEELTECKLSVWSNYAGTLFRCYDGMSEDHDLYYLDDYDESESFNTWLKDKYKIPYFYNPYSEKQKQIKKFIEDINLSDDETTNYYKKRGMDNLKPIDILMFTIDIFGGNELLERLTLDEIFEIDKTICYEYDLGDNWIVNIELLDIYETDLKLVSEELNKTITKVKRTLSPVCIDIDGLGVFDDAGGIYGYVEFLKGVHNIKNSYDYDSNIIKWGKSLGWKDTLPLPEKLL